LANIDHNKITWFPDSVIKDITLPLRFTFPFYYEPHPLAKLAAAQLQHYLETHTDLGHNFGLTNNTDTLVIGKMFGILVVQDKEGKVGYLSAFSGKLAGTNDHPMFVPPVFDMLTENSFFLKEQEVIDAINTQIEEIETDENYHQIKRDLERLTAQSIEEISAFKNELNSNKENRRLRREENATNADPIDFELVEADLSKQSHYDRHRLRLLTAKWKEVVEEKLTILAQFEDRIEALRNERKERSATLQGQLFEQYSFLNKAGKSKSLHDIFSVTAFGRPPSAAGECATPKLLQFAFAHGYHPLAMAEFWWGSAPRSEIRKHKQFYPACTGKCKPILAHMLEGLAVDENPFLQATASGCNLEIIYEDECFLIVNKPSGLRSVPGVDISDSVYSRLKATLTGTEPLIVHRLDMGTSGLLVVAKTAAVHKHIQKQFLDRVVKKRYTALLSGTLPKTEGEINLPLRPDLFNRPRQMVCFENGKTSITKWKAVETIEGVTKVHFWPLTGRTHQLRMHAAHELGLNTPIVGDDIYGSADTRLYLHAASLSFIHPETKVRVSFEIAEDF
jgi:tRNA pseudouridine32 synthase / 23S rRNA pseudouridine746 synthase